MLELEKVHPDGIYLSGALLMFAGNKSYYLYGASSNDYRDFLPNHHMQMMQYAKNTVQQRMISVVRITIQTKIQNIMDCGHSNVYGAHI